MSPRHFPVFAIYVVAAVGAARLASAADEIVLEASSSGTEMTTDYEAVAKRLLQEATKNANLRQAIANPSLSVSLYVGQGFTLFIRFTVRCGGCFV